MSEPLRRSLPASTITWAALALTLCHLCLVFLDGAVQLAAPLRALRTLLSLPVLFVPGLPLALWLCGRGSRGGAEGGRVVGAFTLLFIALGASLVLNFCVVDVARSIAPPVSGRLFSLTGLAGAGVLLLLSGRLEQLRVGLERGLTPWPLIVALALVLGFGFAARGRLYSGLDRYVLNPTAAQQILEREGRLQDPNRFKISFTSGVRPAEDGWYRATAAEVRVTLTNPRTRPAPTFVGFAITAPLGTGVQLVRLDGTSCGAARGAKHSAQRLAVTRVPEEVLGHKLAPAVTDFNSVIAAPIELSPGDTCLALRLKPPAATPANRVSLAEISHDLVAGAPRLGRRLLPVPPATVEAHLSGVWYRAQMLRSNEIEPHMLLWGYFAQFVLEQLAGDKDQAVGASFLLFCLLSFFAALVMVGVAGAPAGKRDDQRDDQVPTWRSLIVGLLLLGPLFVQIYGLTFAPYGSFAFPDAAYTFFIVAAVAMLLQRNRVGFILLGCLGAFARYPGAYVMVVALVARLALFKEDRAWTLRTLLWALVAGLVVVGLLLAHYHATSGVSSFVEAAYSEVFPEHFSVLKDAAPAWFRVLCFFCKLALLSSFTLLLWPLVRGAAGKLMIAVTLGYAVTLMAVHVPHLHYFPILTYCTAAAGLRAVAQRQLLPMVAAVVLVPVGTGLALVVESLLHECLGCYGG